MTNKPPDVAPQDGVELTHPGFEWLDRASCAWVEGDERAKRVLDGFFVEAGRVISTDARELCRDCPVRRECVVHAYLGGADGLMILSGYFGGLSMGQR